MPKGVGDVADGHFGAKFPGRARALQQVADVRLGADQEHVWQDVPGADQDAPVFDVLAQDGLFFGPHVQVIVEHDGLPVEHKMFEIGVVFEDVEQPVDQVDEFEAELLKGEVPFAVPVCV